MHFEDNITRSIFLSTSRWLFSWLIDMEGLTEQCIRVGPELASNTQDDRQAVHAIEGMNKENPALRCHQTTRITQYHNRTVTVGFDCVDHCKRSLFQLHAFRLEPHPSSGQLTWRKGPPQIAKLRCHQISGLANSSKWGYSKILRAFVRLQCY